MTVLGIAGWRIQLECDSPALTERIAVRYAAFQVPDVDTIEAMVMIALDTQMAGSGRSGLSGVRDGCVVRFDLAEARGKIDLETWNASLILNAEGDLWALEHLLKVVCAYLALRQGGLLFHCAGLLMGGQAYLFTGRSGSGKSTVVALSPHAAALNDDMVVLRPYGGAWWAFGTPFWNADATTRKGQTAAGPVAGIFKLVQDRREYVEPVSAAVAASELVANCPVVNGDPVELPAVIERCHQLISAVPVQRLHFRKTPGFWELVQGRSIG